jgi:hypothetical protein
MIKIRRGSSAKITDALIILGSKATAPGQLVDFSDSKGDAANTTAVTLLASDNLDLNAIKKGSSTGTVDAKHGTTGGADTSVFAWTKYSF